MPTQTFSSNEAYAETSEDASLRPIFLGPKLATWVLSYLSINNLSAQWGQVGAPGVEEATVKPGGRLIFMPSQNAQTISGNGRRFDDLSLMVLRPGQEFCFSATNCNRWFSVFVPNEILTDTAVTAEGQKYQGDFLVLATGSQANFFGTPGADKHSYPLYSLHDAELLRSRILAVLESADRDSSLIVKGALNFVSVGAGPTGAEMAGALGGMAHRALRKQRKTFQNLDVGQAQIILVDQGHAVLNAFSEKAQTCAANMLKKRGVQLRLGTSVKEVGSGRMLLSDGTSIKTRTVIWAGGLKASALSGNLGIQPGHGSRIDVQPDLTVKGFDGVYGLGDFANISDEDGKPCRNLHRSRNSPASGAPAISHWTLRASPESPFVTSTRASWP